MRKMTPAGIRKIRKILGFSQEEFARVTGATFQTINRWEAGRTGPMGLHLRILYVLEENLARPGFKLSLQHPRGNDPMFLVYQLLEPLYGAAKPKKRAPKHKF